jgi:predicted lipid-binding transport protein (Tim44 family)
MNFTPQSAVQRIQVGLIGLVIVLLFVSIANVMSDRTSSAAAGSPQAKVNAAADAAKSEQRQDEPLAELGVAPAVSEQPQTAKTKPPVN